MRRIELMSQIEFENEILDIIKLNEHIESTVEAVNKYNEIINNVIEEDCKIDENTSSIREGIWNQLVKLNYVPF